MSKENLAKIVQRAISDAGFRRQLSSDPAGALRGFNLSADEMAAIRAGDAGRLSALGVDQRMSKAFVLGATVGATRLSASDLSSGPTVIDDGSSSGIRGVIPADPEATLTADDAGTKSAAASGAIHDDPDGFLAANADAGGSAGSPTVRAGDDWKFAGRVAPEGGTVRTGDDWKFDASQKAAGGDMSNYPAHDGLAGPSGAGQARVGDDWKYDSQKAAGGDMANYPAHDGLAGPTGVGSVRVGDDWKFAGSGASQGAVAPVEGSPEQSAADIAAGEGTVRSAINDDPDGFLAANANADDSITRANVIHDDPDGFLAANADDAGSVTRANVIHDDPDGFLAANANDTTGSTPTTAFVDESESYLTKVGYDPNAAASIDAGETTYSGDDMAGPAATTDGGSDTTADTTNDPQISS